MLFFALLALSIIIIYIIGIKQKNAKVYISVSFLTYIFILSVMCVNFYLFKFTNSNQLIFPDENLYVYDYSSTLFFSYYVQFVEQYLGLDVVRAINVIVFSISISILSSEIFVKVSGFQKQLTLFFALLGSVVGGYWAFFILKEAFSVAALSMLVIAQVNKSKSYFCASVLLLSFARIELLALYVGVSILFILKTRVKPIYYLSFVLAIVLFILFMNNEASYSLKLFTLSRRFGEEDFKFDDIAVNSSHLQLIPFILSEPFRQAVITNLNSSFNPLMDFNPFVFLQRFYNLLAFFVFLICSKRYLLNDKLYTFTFIIIVGVLCTHSVYRYINTILVPLTLYFIFLLSFNKSKVQLEKNHNNNPNL
ncbi:hypothetical protein [Enterobacter cloacae]|uniref:hypothetical protein n=2 Tax=Enterobacter cloacae TaxID=550 RepID=UPI0029C0CBA8|nr:hypothetical protein [Enterobacter cloacae]